MEHFRKAFEPAIWGVGGSWEWKRIKPLHTEVELLTCENKIISFHFKNTPWGEISPSLTLSHLVNIFYYFFLFSCFIFHCRYVSLSWYLSNQELCTWWRNSNKDEFQLLSKRFFGFNSVFTVENICQVCVTN